MVILIPMKREVNKLIELMNLRDEKNHRTYIYIGFALLFVLSLFARKSLIKFQDADYQIFSSWYNFVKIHGIHSFKYGFSNYNPPYTYFLYILTILPISKIVAIKGLLAVFDIVLAVSVYSIVKFFSPRTYLPFIAGLVTMFLPTVLFTGVLWGQFDQLYVAFMLLSLSAILRDNSKWAWIFFGIAIAVKFQAIFFLPVLGIMVFKKINWYDFIWGVGAFLILTLPPVLVGRPIGSLLDIYPSQARLFNGMLTLNAPNLYQWFPSSAFPYFNHMATALAFASVIIVLIIALWYKKFSSRDLMVATTLILYVVPFLLPEMHERYFFPAGIASVVLAFAYPDRTFISMAVLMQVITLFSYCPFLFGTTPIPLGVLALGVLLIICILTFEYLSTTNKQTLKRLNVKSNPVK